MSPLLLILETYCFKITKLELSLTKKIEHPSTVLRWRHKSSTENGVVNASSCIYITKRCPHTPFSPPNRTAHQSESVCLIGAPWSRLSPGVQPVSFAYTTSLNLISSTNNTFVNCIKFKNNNFDYEM